MRKALFPVVVLAACFVVQPAHAQSAEAFMKNPAFRDPPPRECISTFDMQHCAAHDLRVADRQMSDSYFALRKRVSPSKRVVLLKEQRQWLVMRDRTCREKARRSGGTMAPVVGAQCYVDVTKARNYALSVWR
jgi:uncharacterized protein YecT (DUF1311 family)